MCLIVKIFFFFKRKAAYEMRISDWISDVCSSDRIVQGRGSANSVNVFIRGIGQPDALQTFDPGVGIYVDDVYYSRINGALFSLFDVAQVAVLRGPQGTLYGKNSTGEIGRAECRERVCQYVQISVVAGTLKKKK